MRLDIKYASKVICRTMFCFIALLSAPTVSKAAVNVYFSPSRHCEQSAVRIISEARYRLDIAVFSLTNTAIVNAIIKAHERGVLVRVLMDKTAIQDKNSLFNRLYCHNSDLAHRPLIRMKVNARQAKGLQHNKYIIVDSGIRVFTGSYNFTQGANINKENCLVFTLEQDLAAQYSVNFEQLWNEQDYVSSFDWLLKNHKLPCANSLSYRAFRG